MKEIPQTSDGATTLFRPVGQAELDKIAAADWRRFPPRFRHQPIFYPVLTEAYAIGIARNWNTTDPVSGFAGYVTKFLVRDAFLRRYEIQKVGGSEDLEYWIPAEELEAFNDNIVGNIEVIHSFFGEQYQQK